MVYSMNKMVAMGNTVLQPELKLAQFVITRKFQPGGLAKISAQAEILHVISP